MNLDMLEESLKIYTPREKLYKQRYEENGCPQTFSVPDHYSEQTLFSPSRNVMLTKHDRYSLPVPHDHSFFELTYVLSGQCTQTIHRQPVSLHTGDICFIPLHTEHSISVFDDSIIINILLRHNTFNDIFFNTLRQKTILSTFFLHSLYKDAPDSYILFPTAGDPDLRRQVLEMYLEELANDEYCDNILIHMISIFFNQLLRRYSRSAIVADMEQQTVREQMDIVAWLQTNYKTATLSNTAAHFHYTDSYCSRLIKELTGHTFVSLLREIRMSRAEFLLTTTNISIENLAEELGYQNPETFIRIFKKSRGMTPGQYRKLHSRKESSAPK